MCRLKIKELVSEAHATVPELPAKHARIMKEVATRLEATYTALTESLAQLEKLIGKAQ